MAKETTGYRCWSSYIRLALYLKNPKNSEENRSFQNPGSRLANIQRRGWGIQLGKNLWLWCKLVRVYTVKNWGKEKFPRSPDNCGFTPMFVKLFCYLDIWIIYNILYLHLWYPFAIAKTVGMTKKNRSEVWYLQVVLGILVLWEFHWLTRICGVRSVLPFVMEWWNYTDLDLKIKSRLSCYSIWNFVGSDHYKNIIYHQLS